MWGRNGQDFVKTDDKGVALRRSLAGSRGMAGVIGKEGHSFPVSFLREGIFRLVRRCAEVWASAWGMDEKSSGTIG